MKKYILVGIAVVGIALMVVYGPALLGVYRLTRFVAQSHEAYVAEGGPWPQLMDVCVFCHGVKGQSLHQGYASLAGQPAAYLEAQLRSFAGGQRANPNMAPLAMTLSDAEIKQLAAYYSRQPAMRKHYFEPDGAAREAGATLVKARACAGCHGEQMGGRDLSPRLAGQGYDYLLSQLDAYAAGTRRDPTGAMNALSATASPDERKAMATYLASMGAETQ